MSLQILYLIFYSEHTVIWSVHIYHYHHGTHREDLQALWRTLQGHCSFLSQCDLLTTLQKLRTGVEWITSYAFRRGRWVPRVSIIKVYSQEFNSAVKNSPSVWNLAQFNFTLKLSLQVINCHPHLAPSVLRILYLNGGVQFQTCNSCSQQHKAKHSVI